MKKLKIRIMGVDTTTVMKPKKVYIEAEADIKEQYGSEEELGRMLLEAEMHGNDGKSRIHIFVE